MLKINISEKHHYGYNNDLCDNDVVKEKTVFEKILLDKKNIFYYS